MYRGKRPSKDELQKMSETMSRAEIAKKFGVHYNTASNWFGQYGLPIRDTHKAHNHVDLSEEALEFLDGTMLGDSSIERFGSSGRIRLSSKYEKYAAWYGRQLTGFGIAQSGKIYSNETTLLIGGQENTYVGYRYTSKKYDDLKEYADRFYPDGAKKLVPRNIRITPLSLKMWYIDDGTLAPFGRSSQIVFCTDSFLKEDVGFLVDKLHDIGFSVKYYACRNRVRMNSSSVQDFLDYIGKPTGVVEDCYGYKWRPILNLDKNGRVRRAGDKLSDEAVREIRLSDLSQSKLSKRHGVGSSTIWRIKNGQAYTNVS